MIIAQTPRLIVRRLQRTDVPALVAIWGDRDVTRHVGGPRARDTVEEALETELRSPPPDDLGLWPVIEKTGELIGDCGLQRKDVDGRPEIELVYVFARKAWGRGYATEVAAAIRDYAFERLGVERLIALIDPANVASERVAQKIGMKHEKDTLRPDGEWRRVYSCTARRPTHLA